MSLSYHWKRSSIQAYDHWEAYLRFLIETSTFLHKHNLSSVALHLYFYNLWYLMGLPGWCILLHIYFISSWISLPSFYDVCDAANIMMLQLVAVQVPYIWYIVPYLFMVCTCRYHSHELWLHMLAMYVMYMLWYYNIVPYTKTSSYPPPAISSVWCMIYRRKRRPSFNI